MKKFKVTWYDTNSLIVDAEDEEDAIENIKKLYDKDLIDPNDVLVEHRYEAEEIIINIT